MVTPLVVAASALQERLAMPGGRPEVAAGEDWGGATRPISERAARTTVSRS
jgi:hypothetical protein